MKKFLNIFFIAIILCGGIIGITHACSSNQIDIGNGNCETAKFTITTTNLTAGTEFKWYMSASGTFYVDCGDGGTLSGTGVTNNTITRNDTNEVLYTCTYDTAGTKTIRMAGLATGYKTDVSAAAIRFGNLSDDATPTLIASINGSIGQIMVTLGQYLGGRPRFMSTFSGTRIISLPENLFAGVSGGETFMFSNTFANCTSLTHVPDTLFEYVTIPADYLFHATFTHCTSLTEIPEDLFSGIMYCTHDLFYHTFSGCTGLTIIPSGLFSHIKGSGSWAFYSTFRDCTGLTSLPSGLFAGIEGASDYEFYYTFLGCSNLSGFIPPDLFAGLIANGSPSANNMWYNTFYATALAMLCPTGYTQYTTGYETEWATNSGVAAVSCAPNTINITWEDATPESVAANNAGSCTYGGTINTPAVAPSRRGYVFTGWSFDTSGN